MNDDGWEGLDPEVRAQAAAAALAHGVSLEDYLADIVLGQKIAPPPPAEAPGLAADPAKPAFSLPRRKMPDDFTVAHRLDALERRITTAVASLDQAIAAVDGSISNLAGRVQEQDSAFTDIAETLNRAMNELSGSLAAVRTQVAEAESHSSDHNAARASAQADLAERLADIDQRLSVTDDIARDADRTSAALTRAQDALRRSLADDFENFARTADTRLRADLDALRTAATAAAHHADEAASSVLADMRALRETVEGRLAETAAETQARMHAAFADSVELVTALNSRVVEHERNAAATTESMRARLADLEGAGQSALEATAESFRAAHAALAVDVARIAQDTRGALDTLRGEFAREAAQVRDGQNTAQARLKVLDSAVANTAADLSSVRELIERRVEETATQTRQDLAVAREALERRVEEAAGRTREDLAQTRDAWTTRLDALLARVEDNEAELARGQDVTLAEIHRVEACTLAALEKAAHERAALEASASRAADESAQAHADLERTLKTEIANVALAARAHAEDNDQRLWHELAAVRGQRAGLQARLDSLATKVDADLSRIPSRLAGLESAASAQTTAMEGLRARIEIVESQADAVNKASGARLEDAVSGLAKRIEAGQQAIANRIASNDAATTEAVEHVRNLASVVDRLSTQNADATVQYAERLQNAEVNIAELRMEQSSAAHEITATLIERLQAAEQRQADALEALTTDLVRFLNASDSRLTALERRGDDGVLNAELQALRQGLDARLMEAERKSVRALEQVMETVALIGRKVAHSQSAEDPGKARSA